MDKPDVCGIDVSAKELVVMVERQGQRESSRTFPNTPPGHQQLQRYLARSASKLRVCLEATGLYGLDIALRLQADPRFEVMVANPRSVKNFAQALFQRSKSDPLDTRVLVEYAARMPFQAWQPPSTAALQLTALTRRIHALTEQATQEKNRWHAITATATGFAIVVADLKRSLRSLENARLRLARAARKIIAGDAQLERRFLLLRSLPGVGETSALQLLGELVLIPADADVRQWVAYAGLDPREYSSGSSLKKRPRISKVGNRHVRRALYMPALTAAHHSPIFRAYYLHLQAAGKCKMVALVAVMRKLLHAIFGMFKHDTVFEAVRIYPAFAAEPAVSAALAS
ncbi:MAG TPA: IS110 family transposase [Terracidiphilus sp.]|nr:IS110 family transposase [Terracidiphilus sp.]